MATLSSAEFDTVTEFGSGVAWTDLSEIQNPQAGGYAYASMSALDTTTLWVDMDGIDGISAIPTGSTFTSMAFARKQRKDGASSTVTFYGDCNLSSSLVWSSSVTAAATWQQRSSSGDRSYWNMTSYTPAEIISHMKAGTFQIRFYAEETAGVADDISVKDCYLTVVYETVRSELGAIMVPLVG